jgi:hypothetical protein
VNRDTWKGLRDVADELDDAAIQLEEWAAEKRVETPALAGLLAGWAEDIRELTGEDPLFSEPMPREKGEKS